MEPLPSLTQDRRPARGAWAPGGHTGPCAVCQKQFIGDKRARHCADCAYAAADSSPAPPNGLVRFKMTPPEGWRFCIGERVRKRSGSSWRGFVCGYYWSTLTERGVCVESMFEAGSVQLYPEHALEPWDGC